MTRPELELVFRTVVPLPPVPLPAVPVLLPVAIWPKPAPRSPIKPTVGASACGLDGAAAVDGATSTEFGDTAVRSGTLMVLLLVAANALEPWPAASESGCGAPSEI